MHEAQAACDPGRPPCRAFRAKGTIEFERSNPWTLGATDEREALDRRWLHRQIAKITGPQFHDMFWRSYAVEYLTANGLTPEMEELPFWYGVRFFSIGLNEYISNAIVSTEPFDNGRLVVRGKYVTDKEMAEISASSRRPTWWRRALGLFVG